MQALCEIFPSHETHVVLYVQFEGDSLVRVSSQQIEQTRVKERPNVGSGGDSLMRVSSHQAEQTRVKEDPMSDLKATP
jgi:hypothetical protein